MEHFFAPFLFSQTPLPLEGGEASKKHNVLFAAGVGFYNPIIILLPVFLYDPRVCLWKLRALRSHPQTHRSPRGGTVGSLPLQRAGPRAASLRLPTPASRRGNPWRCSSTPAQALADRTRARTVRVAGGMPVSRGSI